MLGPNFGCPDARRLGEIPFVLFTRARLWSLQRNIGRPKFRSTRCPIFAGKGGNSFQVCTQRRFVSLQALPTAACEDGHGVANGLRWSGIWARARPIAATKSMLFRSTSWRWRALGNSSWCPTGKGRQTGQTPSQREAAIHAKQVAARAARLALIRGAGTKLSLPFEAAKGAESVRTTRCASGCFLASKESLFIQAFLGICAGIVPHKNTYHTLEFITLFSKIAAPFS
ncbi:hypothetical protein ERJ75_000228400 [Trypanosoma vivax]|nr:hypothetical protein TRVL_08631 [Trypanosoma vivax]KAH8618901.1 hypothetical protein ERJ75_000228400 [Trypanosoma vivax]